MELKEKQFCFFLHVNNALSAMDCGYNKGLENLSCRVIEHGISNIVYFFPKKPNQTKVKKWIATLLCWLFQYILMKHSDIYPLAKHVHSSFKNVWIIIVSFPTSQCISIRPLWPLTYMKNMTCSTFNVISKATPFHQLCVCWFGWLG